MEKQKIMDFANRVYRDMAGAMTVGMADLGTRTGLFQAMAGKGAMTAADLAQATGLQLRYVDEWLRGMTAAEYLFYDAGADTYLLPDEHAYLLASEGSDHFVGGLYRFAPVLLSKSAEVAEAFQTGGGVKFDAFGEDCVHALDMINAGTYDQRFTSYWLAALPDITAKLEQGLRVLDVGCGTGRVSRNIVAAFPNSRAVGLDLDAASITEARAQTQAAGLAGKVDFVCESTRTFAPADKFDLITACDCIHDFAEPLATLNEIRELLAPGGTLFVVEPKAADDLADNIHPIGAMYYGFSLFHCMTQSLACGGPGLGTCMGPAKTLALLGEAGFSKAEPVSIKSLTNAFYLATA